MPLRTRLFIVISLVALLILAISIFLIVRSKKAAAPATQSNTTSAPVDSSGQTVVIPAGSQNSEPAPALVATPEAVQQNAAKQLAKIFIERYGSYSTDNNFSNIKDVQNMVTPALWQKLSARMNTPATGTFVGVTTLAVGAAITNWSETAATVELNTRKNIEQNGAAVRKYQDATVSMVKSGDTWLADSFSWGK